MRARAGSPHGTVLTNAVILPAPPAIILDVLPLTLVAKFSRGGNEAIA